jgi:hypothetical protein
MDLRKVSKPLPKSECNREDVMSVALPWALHRHAYRESNGLNGP